MPTIRRRKLAGAFIAPMGPLHVSPRYTLSSSWILRSGSCVVDLAKDPLPSHRYVPQGLPTVPLKSSTARSSRPSDVHEDIATVSTSRKRFSATTGRGTFTPADTDGPKRDLTPFSSPVLEADSLCKSYAIGEVLTPALLDVSLAVQPASFVSIMGPSGCGKSTLLHLLGGLDRADSGDVRLEGMSLAQMDETERTLLRRRRIGFVFQKVHLLPMLTALENVLVPLRLDGLHTEVARERAMQALESVAMSHRAGHRPGELSGGEAQRVASPGPWSSNLRSSSPTNQPERSIPRTRLASFSSFSSLWRS